MVNKYPLKTRKKGTPDRSNGYRAMRKTNLKEMHIIRYADDFRILCRTKDEAERIKIAVTQWLSERLKLKVSQEKTRIVNTKQKAMEFLGFKIWLRKKGQKYVVRSHICDKALKRSAEQLIEQAKNIAKPRSNKTERDEVVRFNSMVMGKQNYYQIATEISQDCRYLHRRVMTVMKSRLKEGNKGRIKRKGRQLTAAEEERYGNSRMLRYEANSGEPIYPIGYVQHKKPMSKKRCSNCYTKEGRKELHENLPLSNQNLLLKLMQSPSYGRSAEFMDNRISLFSMQSGKCAITGIEFKTVEEIHCHHIDPKWAGGTDKFSNLALVLEDIHRLIHAVEEEVINKYRQKAGLKEITTATIN